MAYRLLLARDREQQLMEVQAQVDAGSRHGWVTIDSWRHEAPSRLTANALTALVDEICAEHGWLPLEATGNHRTDLIDVPVRPTDWRRVLTAATEHRASQRNAYDAADLAWQTVVADTPRQGEDGYVGAIEIANLAGMTRYRIYQIQGVGKKPGLKPAPTRRDGGGDAFAS